MTLKQESGFPPKVLAPSLVLGTMLLFTSAATVAAPLDTPEWSEPDLGQDPIELELAELFRSGGAELGAAGIRSWSALTNENVLSSDRVTGETQLPKNVQAMLQAMQELQSLRTEYDTTVEKLIEAAKKLDENPSGNAANVSALARKAEQLRRRAVEKQHALWKEASRGVFLNKAFGQSNLDNPSSHEPSPGARGEIKMWPRPLRSQGPNPQYDALQ